MCLEDKFLLHSPTCFASDNCIFCKLVMFNLHCLDPVKNKGTAQAFLVSNILRKQIKS